MDRNILNNIYTLLIFIRDDIENSENKQICNLILSCRGNNAELTSGMENITSLKSWRKRFKYDKGEEVKVNQYEWDIFTALIKKALQAFERNNINLAYDLVDAVHFLPEIMSEGKRLQLRPYFSHYIKPLLKKYGKGELAEIKKSIGSRLFIL